MSLPDWVQDDVIAGLQTVAAQLEVIAGQNALNAAKVTSFSMAVATGPAPSASVAAPTQKVSGLITAMGSLYGMIPSLVSPTAGIDQSVSQGLIALASGLVAAMDAASAAAAFAAAADNTPDAAAPPTANPTANRLADAANLQTIARFSRMVFLSGYVQALVTATYPTRSEAITARADCVDRFERELALAGGASDIGVIAAMTGMRDAAVAYLTQAVINAQPVLDIQGPALPAIWWAWTLYQDPTRASELLALNGVPTAEFMPTQFEAKAA